MDFRVGIILTAYNVEKTIDKALSAITPDLLAHIQEILVIDNRSEDATVAIVERHRENGSPLGRRISLLLHE